MSDSIRIRASELGGLATVRVRLTHLMESGLRRDPSGKPVPAHFITEVEALHNGRTVLRCDWSGAVSQNPLLVFKFKGAAKGDTVRVAWADNRGAQGAAEAAIA